MLQLKLRNNIITILKKKPDGHNPSGFEITEESITAEVRAPIEAVG